MFQRLMSSLFKKTPIQHRRPATRRPVLELLEDRLCPSGLWKASLTGLGSTLTVKEVVGNGSSIVISETAGLITVTGGLLPTSINGGTSFSVPASSVTGINVDQNGNNDNFSLSISGIVLPAATITISLGRGTTPAEQVGFAGDIVCTSGNTVNAIIVTAPANGNVVSYSSYCDTVAGLFVTEGNASGDSVSIKGLLGGGFVIVSQGNGSGDSIYAACTAVGIQQYTQGNGAFDYISISALAAISVTATQGNGADDAIYISKFIAATATLCQGNGDSDVMIVACNLTGAASLSQGTGASDQIVVAEMGALSLTITQSSLKKGGDYCSLLDVVVLGSLFYTGGAGVDTFQAQNVHAGFGIVDGGGNLDLFITTAIPSISGFVNINFEAFIYF